MMVTLGYSFWWKKYLTQLQIVQFFFDMMCTWPGILAMKFLGNWHCSGEWWTVWFGQGVGISFIILFTSFYLEEYNQRKKLIAKKEKEKEKEKEEAAAFLGKNNKVIKKNKNIINNNHNHNHAINGVMTKKKKKKRIIKKE